MLSYFLWHVHRKIYDYPTLNEIRRWHHLHVGFICLRPKPGTRFVTMEMSVMMHQRQESTTPHHEIGFVVLIFHRPITMYNRHCWVSIGPHFLLVEFWYMLCRHISKSTSVFLTMNTSIEYWVWRLLLNPSYCFNWGQRATAPSFWKVISIETIESYETCT